MGIQDINKFLKDNGVPFTTIVNPSDYCGYRVVIDASLWICTNAPSFFRDALRELVDPVNDDIDHTIIMNRMIHQAIRFQLFWFRHGITPVWIWEGGHPPDKDITKEERRLVREKQQSKVDTLKSDLRLIDPLLRPVQKIDELKKAIIATSRVDKDEVLYLQGMIAGLGFPSITAPEGVEGDPICASLCINLLAVATWSTDTDHYAYGTPLLMTGFGPRDELGQDTLELSIIPVIKASLGWTQEQLREFCIMSGCDYNKRIPNHGCKKGLKLLTEHNWSIDELAAKRPDLPVANLNAKRSRELLIAPKCGFINDDPALRVNKLIFADQGRILAEHFGIQAYFNDLVKYINELPDPQMVVLSE
jgi:5'-3' exonuclease